MREGQRCGRAGDEKCRVCGDIVPDSGSQGSRQVRVLMIPARVIGGVSMLILAAAARHSASGVSKVAASHGSSGG